MKFYIGPGSYREELIIIIYNNEGSEDKWDHCHTQHSHRKSLIKSSIGNHHETLDKMQFKYNIS